MLSIKQRQLNLYHCGYFYKGKIDSVEGAKTKKAYKAFQEAQKLKIDGIYGDKTEAALLQYVKDIQAALNKAGAALKIDGIVGDNTVATIKNFQKKNKLKADGIVGKKTYAKLVKYIAALPVKTTIWDKTNHKLSEFICGCKKNYCNGYPAELDSDIISVIEDVEAEFGLPVIITSGLRCVKYNKIVGGISNSKHLQGKAADISLNFKSTNDQKLHAYLLKHPKVSYTYTGFGAVHFDVK